MVYLAPIPTFYRIYRKNMTEGFQSLPYAVALFSSILLIFYAFIKTNEYLLITINSFGCVIEMIYNIMYLAYAPRKAKAYIAKLIMPLNVGLFSVIVLSTFLLAMGANRHKLLGWICVSFAVSVFAAHLSIIIPNILGFSFGVVQMGLYIIYRDVKVLKEELKLPKQMTAAAKLGEIVVGSQVASEEIALKGDEMVKEETCNGVEMCPV